MCSVHLIRLAKVVPLDSSQFCKFDVGQFLDMSEHGTDGAVEVRHQYDLMLDKSCQATKVEVSSIG